MSESFRRFEMLLPRRFNDDLWMTTYPIEVL